LEQDAGFGLHFGDHCHVVKQGACHAGFGGFAFGYAVKDFLKKRCCARVVLLGDFGLDVEEFLVP
jgi:hypothetical protein